MKFKKTFTLIELICSLFLISIITAILTINGLQMVKKIKENKDLDKLSQILKELELRCLLTKGEGSIKLFQKKGFLEIEVDYPFQKQNPKVIKNLKITPFQEGYSQELLFHPYKGWDKQLNVNLKNK